MSPASTAVVPWGPNGEFGSAGEFRETTVTAPNPCVVGNTTTTTTTTSTTTTTAPPTTAPPTTAPPTTVPSSTAPPTTVPSSTVAPTTVAQSTTAAPTTAAVTTGAPTTIGVQVGGIIEERASVGVLARTGPRPVTTFFVVGLSLVLIGAFIELRARTRSNA